MAKFIIHYTKKSYYSCEVDAQNEGQVRHLFEQDMLDLNGENHGDTELGEIRSVEKMGEE
jgi:hypothetical protein